MRVGVMSDIHVPFHGEWAFPLEPMAAQKPDAVILAGDISDDPYESVSFAKRVEKECDCHVIMILGNHEFYCARPYDVVIDEGYRLTKDEPRIHFLENDVVELNGTLICGGTLWTDFALFSDVHPRHAMSTAAKVMNDFRYGRQRRTDPSKLKRLQPRFVRNRHFETRSFIEGFIEGLGGNKGVVVTHHAPTAKSVAAKYRYDSLSSAYASRLDYLVAKAGCHNVPLWVHGHIHVTSDYEISGCRVVCNPYGYFDCEVNGGFNPALVIDL